MKDADIILATGGPGMVKAAYSSGKPALGVGAGNTPVIIDDTADVKMAVNSIIQDVYKRQICCHDRYISLNRMCHNINTRSACQSFWLCHHIVYVYNCHIRQQFIISNRPFYTSLSISDDCKRRHLRTDVYKRQH